MQNAFIYCYYALFQNVSSEVVLIDCMADKLQGEMLDLQHGSTFLKNAKVHASTGMLHHLKLLQII